MPRPMGDQTDHVARPPSRVLGPVRPRPPVAQGPLRRGRPSTRGMRGTSPEACPPEARPPGAGWATGTPKAGVLWGQTWGAGAAAVLAVAKRLEGDGARTQIGGGGTEGHPPKGGGGRQRPLPAQACPLHTPSALAADVYPALTGLPPHSGPATSLPAPPPPRKARAHTTATT